MREQVAMKKTDSSAILRISEKVMTVESLRGQNHCQRNTAVRQELDYAPEEHDVAHFTEGCGKKS